MIDGIRLSGICRIKFNFSLLHPLHFNYIKRRINSDLINTLENKYEESQNFDEISTKTHQFNDL